MAVWIWDKLRAWRKAIILAALLLAIAVFLLGAQIPLEARALPGFALLSLGRLVAAFFVSLAFSIAYGYFAATNERAGRVMLPMLDVLQSVPILGFFPAAVFFFIALTPGSSLGVEFAAIFLIFTSMAWNMALGVYESIRGIPSDVKDAVFSFTPSRFLRFKRLFLPSCVPKLAYNSMMSWAGGWYFLIASEIISLGSESHKLEGIGAFLIEASAAGRADLIASALVMIAAIIISTHLLVWRPLTVWAEKFKYEDIGAEGLRGEYVWSRMYTWFPALKWFRGKTSSSLDKAVNFGRAAIAPISRARKTPFGKAAFGALGKLAVVAIAVSALLFSAGVAVYFAGVFSKPLSKEVYDVPAAFLFSSLRLALAYVISLAWTVPAAVFVAKNRHAEKFLLPFFEITASIPATAFFPVITLFIVGATGSMDLAATVFLMTGMQWYLFFNLVAGVRSIPEDLEQAARSYGLKGWLYWKRLLLPAMFPSFVTGSIAAWGGGWNALVVSEFVVFGKQTCEAFGIGSLLDRAVYGAGGQSVFFGSCHATVTGGSTDAALMAITLATMIVAILVTNALVWRRLFNIAAKKYSLEQS